MTHVAHAKDDLVVLVPDAHIQAAVLGLMERPQRLGIRPIRVGRGDVPVFAGGCDPACLLRSQDILRGFVDRYDHALVMFDRIGCGAESESAADLEKYVEHSLHGSGWHDRCAAVVIDPELEAWVWSSSPHVARCLGWAGHRPALRDWLAQNGYWSPRATKPTDPKSAFHAALHEVRHHPSASIYREIALHVSLRHCTDPAFCRLRCILQAWFPPEVSARA